VERIAVLTSGGDSPGMNAAVRAAVRMAIEMKMQVFGVRRGFAGLIGGEFEQMTARSVGGIIQRGGTILQTARSAEFMTEKGQLEAIRNINRLGIGGLIVIGGNGSLTGALALHEKGVPVIGLPATIDNDISGTGMAIGVDTALNTALDAIDKIKDTASSHSRAFVIEVMGRNCGYLALMSALAGGAEMVLIPEVDVELSKVATELRDAYVRGKEHSIVVVAEGAKHRATDVARYLAERKGEAGFEVRLTILGHVQRGGSPSAFDRILATRFGARAVEELAKGTSGKMIGVRGTDLILVDLKDAVCEKRGLDLYLYELQNTLSR